MVGSAVVEEADFSETHSLLWRTKGLFVHLELGSDSFRGDPLMLATKADLCVLNRLHCVPQAASM